MTEKRSFTINRATLRCGGDGKYASGRGYTALLNNRGFMCCLGQISHQCGLPKKSLRNKGTPDLISTKYKERANLAGLLIEGETGYQSTYLSNKAMNINDNEQLTNREREKLLKDLFQACGYKIKFVGKYVKQNNT